MRGNTLQKKKIFQMKNNQFSLTTAAISEVKTVDGRSVSPFQISVENFFQKEMKQPNISLMSHSHALYNTNCLALHPSGKLYLNTAVAIIVRNEPSRISNWKGWARW